MDQSSIIGSLSAPDPPQAPTLVFAGFWRRLFAFVVDILLVSIPGFLLGHFFYGFFSRDPRSGPLIGFVITIPYFAFLGSSAGGGQTVGQLWTGIEIVDAEGRNLSLGKSLLRYTVLLVPLFFTGMLPGWFEWLTPLAVLAIIYLYVCNTPTRQSLHDLATRSFVVEEPGIGTVEPRPVWPGHWLIIGLLGVIFLVAAVLLNRTGPLQELLTLRKALQDSGQFWDVSIAVQNNYRDNTTYLRVAVSCKDKPANYEEAGARIVSMVERSDPEAGQNDFITVDFKEGFQVGLARFSKSYHVTHTPQQWKMLSQHQGD
jgi:uncharacterized RDD family membrane protein YckC